MKGIIELKERYGEDALHPSIQYFLGETKNIFINSSIFTHANERFTFYINYVIYTLFVAQLCRTTHLWSFIIIQCSSYRGEASLQI